MEIKTEKFNEAFFPPDVYALFCHAEIQLDEKCATCQKSKKCCGVNMIVDTSPKTWSLAICYNCLLHVWKVEDLDKPHYGTRTISDQEIKEIIKTKVNKNVRSKSKNKSSN